MMFDLCNVYFVKIFVFGFNFNGYVIFIDFLNVIILLRGLLWLMFIKVNLGLFLCFS